MVPQFFAFALTLLPYATVALDSPLTFKNTEFEKRSIHRRHDEQVDQAHPQKQVLRREYDPTPDPDADYATWFLPTPSQRSSESQPSIDSTLRKRQGSRRGGIPNPHPNHFDFSTGNTTWNVTFTSCASKGSKVLASSWTSLNGTKVENVTWHKIYMDAMDNQNNYPSFEDALDAGTVKTIRQFIQQFASKIGGERTLRFSPEKEAYLGKALVPAQLGRPSNVAGFTIETNRFKLRRADTSSSEDDKDPSFVPNRRTVAYLGVVSVLTNLVTSGFSISANQVNKIDRITWGNWQSGTASMILIWLTALITWVASPKFRGAVNRLTANGVAAVVVEKASRTLNGLTGHEVYSSGTSAGGSAGSTLNDIIEPVTLEENGVKLPDVEMSNWQYVGSWLDSSAALLDQGTPASNWDAALDNFAASNPFECIL